MIFSPFPQGIVLANEPLLVLVGGLDFREHAPRPDGIEWTTAG